MTSNQSDLTAAVWRKSSYSNGSGGDCVEVARDIVSTVPVRDSKNPQGPVIMIPASAWTVFVASL